MAEAEEKAAEAPKKPKEKLFQTHAARAGDTFVEEEGEFRCESCPAMLPSEEVAKVHVWEHHGAGPGPLLEDVYIKADQGPRSRPRYKCKLCWHPTPSYSHMLFHLRRAHDVKPEPWETSNRLSCKFFDVLET